jgi:hypothetical protein
VEEIENSSVFNWIANGRQARSTFDPSKGVPLSCVVPTVFPKYLKILHRLHGRRDSIDRPLSAEELGILKIPDCVAVRNLVEHHSRSSSRIYWRDAARVLGIPYAAELTHSWFSTSLRPNPDCWPRFIYGPADGSLDVEECRELVSLLAALTNAQECYFRLPEIPFIATKQNLLFRGPIDEVEPFFARGRFQFTPEYWWPPDHQWCVCSDYDLTFTIVAGPAALVDALLHSRVLECIEVDADIRVDDMAPIPVVASP